MISSKRIPVLVVDGLTIRRGGGIVLLNNLVSKLARKGSNVVHILCNSEADVSSVEHLDNITIYRPDNVSSALDATLFRLINLNGYLDMLGPKAVLLSFNSWSRSKSRQITVHINTMPFLPWRERVASVGYVRAILLKYLSHRALGSSSLNIFESQYLLDLANQSYRKKINNPVVRYFGTDLPSPADKLGFYARANRLITVTSAANHKQNHKVIQAFHAIKNVFPDLELIIVGNEQLIRKDIARTMPNLDYNQIRFSGYLSRQQLADEIGNCLALISLSTTESFYLVAVEAMLCRTPVIVKRIASAEESCGTNALFINDDSPKTVIRAYEELTDEKIWSQLSEQGYLHSRKFGLATCMGAITQDVLENIV